jgi:hypothetical protein
LLNYLSTIRGSVQIDHYRLRASKTKIVDEMTIDLDLRAFHDGQKELIEALIKIQDERRVCTGAGKKAKETGGQSMMESLRVTAVGVSLKLISGSTYCVLEFA